MAYFIFRKNSDNLEGTIYRVAETSTDLNNLILNQSDYKIIEDNNVNFDNIKLNLISIQKYNNDSITFIEDNFPGFWNVEFLKSYVDEQKKAIESFTKNNSNHPYFNQWNSYYNQLNNLNFSDFTFPTTINLEQYFKNNNQPYFYSLQLP